jgi:hypothetical protein
MEDSGDMTARDREALSMVVERNGFPLTQKWLEELNEIVKANPESIDDLDDAVNAWIIS